MPKSSSFYKQASSQRRREKVSKPETIRLPETILRMRQEKGLRGADLCRIAGDLDPKTLNALEKGRISNPSINTLQSVARGLSVTVSDLFRQAEIDAGGQFHVGNQRGAFRLEFPHLGVRLISFTPFTRDFFCGKMMISSRRRIEEKLTKGPLWIYVSTLVGRVEIQVEDRLVSLREGENLFFNGSLKHSYYNPLQRDAVLSLVTVPSFM